MSMVSRSEVLLVVACAVGLVLTSVMSFTELLRVAAGGEWVSCFAWAGASRACALFASETPVPACCGATSWLRLDVEGKGV